MNDQQRPRTYPVEEALRAQNALREVAGLPAEEFPVQAFVGMISDEIEALRAQGHTDEKIANMIATNSEIAITPQEIAEHYAPPESRHR